MGNFFKSKEGRLHFYIFPQRLLFAYIDNKKRYKISAYIYSLLSMQKSSKKQLIKKCGFSIFQKQ